MIRHNEVTLRFCEVERLLNVGINAYCPSCGRLTNVEPKNKGKIGGAISGALSGAYLGSSIGIAGGPLGAIAGTIPGAILGGIFGNSVGKNFDNPVCYPCQSKFKIPSNLLRNYNALLEEYEILYNHEDNDYGIHGFRKKDHR